MKKPRIFVLVLIFIVFSSQTYSQRVNSDSTKQAELDVILKKCADYCEKLNHSVLDFVCREKITEEIYRYSPEAEGYDDMTGHEKITIKGQGQDSVLEEKNVYIYDYQLIRKENKIRERRILLRENNKKKNEEDAQLKTKRFKHKHIISGPIGLLSEYWQEYYEYKIIKRGKFKGDRAIVIEATPIPSMETNNLYGRIWIREDDFSILKIEWAPKSIKNYDLIEENARRLNAKPLIKFYSEYVFEKNGIRFPSKYSVTETYTRQMRWKHTKSKTTVVYRDYKFFTVETEVKY
jgi:hypothetical protein